MHKIHHIGLSGIVFTKCGDVRGSRDYIKATDNDSEVTCEKCLDTMANKPVEIDRATVCLNCGKDKGTDIYCNDEFHQS